MILYLDASAAVKRYVQEPGSSEVQQAIANADAVGTSVISLKDLAWKHRVRGYDAVHLASGLVWQAGLGAGVTFATFDVHLWKAAQAESLSVFPAKLPTLLNAWRQG